MKILFRQLFKSPVPVFAQSDSRLMIWRHRLIAALLVCALLGVLAANMWPDPGRILWIASGLLGAECYLLLTARPPNTRLAALTAAGTLSLTMIIAGFLIGGPGLAANTVLTIVVLSSGWLLGHEMTRSRREVLSVGTDPGKPDPDTSEVDERDHNLFNSMPVGLHRLSPEGAILDCNPALAQMFGYQDHSQLINTDARRIFLERSEYRLWRNRMREHDEVRNFIIRTARRDGTPIWVEDNTVAVRDAQGKICCYEGGLRDVTSYVQAEKKLKLYTKRLEVLQVIDQAVLAGRSRAEIADLAVLRLRELLPCRRASLALFTPASQEAVVYASDAQGQTLLGVGKRMQLSDFGSFSHLERNQPYCVGDILQLATPSPSDEILLAEGIRTYISLPLFTQGELLGSLNLADDKPDKFGANELAIGKELADALAIAMHNARLLHESRDQAEKLASLYTTALSIGSVLDIDALLPMIQEQIAQLMSPDTVAIVLYDPACGDIQIALAVEKGKKITEWENRRVPLGEAGLTGWVIQTRQSLLIGDLLAENPPVPPRHGTRPARAWLGVPLVARDRLVGAISVQSFTPQAFNDSHRQYLESLSTQLAITLENARLFVQTERHLHQVQGLRAIDQAITSSVELNFVLKIVLEQVIRLLEVDAANVLLLNPHSQILNFAARLGFHTGALRQTHLHLGEGYAGQAAINREMIFIADIMKSPGDLDRATALALEGFVSYVAVPLIAKGQVKGVLEIFNRQPLSPNQDWRDYLEALATQAAIAIDNASLFQDLQRSNQELALAYDTTLEGWSRAMELRDQEMEGHAQRVTGLTLRLAKALGIPDKDLGHVRRGALLHDIGKMGIPDSILLKPGPLSEQEWEVMRQHPTHAYNLLLPIPFLRPALDIPYGHHERWDGSGYPRGLQGEEIPLAARIFAVVDVWDALSSDRPYRNAWPSQQVIAYLKEHSGKQFDPQVVAVFLEILNRSPVEDWLANPTY